MEKNIIPKSYEEMYEVYFKGTKTLAPTLVRSFLPYMEESERESLVQDVFLRMLEQGILEKFDAKKSNFGGAVFFTVRTIAVNHLDKRQRNPMTGLNKASLQESTEEGERGAIALDRLEGYSEEKRWIAAEQVAQIMSKAAALEIKGKNRRDRSMKQLLELMLEGYDAQECAERMGVTDATVYNWMKYVQQIAS